jgi:transposase
MSRPTKLDDLVEKRICDALKDGHSYAAAARAGGVDEATVHRWRAEGRDAGAGRFYEFCKRVDAADKEAEDRAVQVLKSAMGGEDAKLAVTAAQYWLQRRRRQEWAETKGQDEAPSEAEVDALVAKIRGSAKAG